MPGKEKINFVELIFNRKPKANIEEAKVSSLLSGVSSQEGDRLKKAAAESVVKVPGISAKFPFGIDIGSSFIKVAQFGKTTQGQPQLIDLEIIDIPVQSRGRGVLERKDAVVRILGNMLQAKTPKESFLSVSNELAELKMMKFPPMPLGEVNEAIDWELKQAYKDKLQDYVVDCLFLNENDANKEGVEVLIAKVAKRDIQEYTNIIKDIGFKPSAMEVDSLSIAYALTTSGQLKEEVVVILDIGYDITSFNVIYNGKLYLSRNLTVNASSLTKSIASYCNVDLNTAENLKLNYGVLANNAEGLKVRTAILPQIENLVSDIEVSFKYFSYQLTQSRVAEFNKLILSGGSANLKGLSELLNTRLGVTIEVANPLKGLDIHPDIQKNFNLEKLAPSLSVCLGLANR